MDHSKARPKKGDTLETLRKGLALLRTFSAEVPELTINDAAEKLGLSRASARRILITLADLGYVAQLGRLFHLRPEVMNLGLTYFSSQSYSSIANPVLHALSEELTESTVLGVLDNFNVFTIAGAIPKGPLMRISPALGRTMPAYAISMGRVLLAGLDETEIDHYLRTGTFVKLTEFTKTNTAELRRVIEAAKLRKFSVVANELAYGVTSMAVPVIDANDAVTVALGASMFNGRSRVRMQKLYLPALRRAADELSEIMRKCKGVPN